MGFITFIKPFKKMAISSCFLVLVSATVLATVEKAEEPAATKEEDIYLATISTDYVQQSYELMITLNSRKLISAIKTRNTKKNKTKVYPVSVLDKPITLVKAVGVTLVSLSCNNFATHRGCDINIEYPSNLTLGKFKFFKAKLEKIEGKWVLTKDGKPFSKMNLVARKLMGLLIGIKRIDVH